MKNLVLENYQDIILNQLRIKTINNNSYPKQFFKSFYFTSFHFKLDSFKNINVIEFLYLFKLIYNKKSYISYYRKKYKEYDIIISLNLIKNNFNFFLLNWLVFIYPILNRRNISLKTKYLKQKEIVFTQTIYNIYPFIPNVYFSTFKAISNKISFMKKDKNNIYFLSKYYNFNRKEFIVK